jgi:hypothetical protein
MSCHCIAYTDSGAICGEPATILDAQCGGLVRAAHAPARDASEGYYCIDCGETWRELGTCLQCNGRVVPWAVGGAS